MLELMLRDFDKDGLNVSRQGLIHIDSRDFFKPLKMYDGDFFRPLEMYTG